MQSKPEGKIKERENDMDSLKNKDRINNIIRCGLRVMVCG
jgi:hypothetical protein